MTNVIITIFVVGYLLIAVENITKINKAGIALLMGVLCWVGVMIDVDFFATLNNCPNGIDAIHYIGSHIFNEKLAEVCQTILFLMGAMTIVETVDSYGGFGFVRRILYTPSPKALLWKVVGLTFILSALLDNMTTSIVMTMVLRSIIPNDRETRIKYAGMVIIAANAGGAFSPIGDVTTIMLWINGNVSTVGIITGIIIPSIICAAVPTLIMSATLKGTIEKPEQNEAEKNSPFPTHVRNIILFLGVGGLIFVPIFKILTHLPPFMGVMLALACLWIAVEIIIASTHANRRKIYESVGMANIISRIDMNTIFFFLGILTAVNTLDITGSLKALGIWLNESVGNIYIVNSLIGVFSSIIDNVPLVASCMGMYPIADAATVAADPTLTAYMQDGLFWELLAYCAGTGGSLLIIGSAAGVVVMGIENLSFVWYIKRFTLLAASGYFAGILWYWFEKTILVGLL